MYEIIRTNKFDQQLAKMLKRGKDKEKLLEIVKMLANNIPLPEKYRDHKLTNYKKYESARECHIEPDWLLVYEKDKNKLKLYLLRTETHSNLF